MGGSTSLHTHCQRYDYCDHHVSLEALKKASEKHFRLRYESEKFSCQSPNANAGSIGKLHLGIRTTDAECLPEVNLASAERFLE
jgi:hypothetical protein